MHCRLVNFLQRPTSGLGKDHVSDFFSPLQIPPQGFSPLTNLTLSQFPNQPKIVDFSQQNNNQRRYHKMLKEREVRPYIYTEGIQKWIQRRRYMLR